MSPSDNILLERWQQRRDANAFQEIVARHGAMVYSVCRRIVRNAADAEEVAQECFLALAQTDSGAVRTLGGWLHRLATHRSLDRMRADSRRAKRERVYTETRPHQTDPTWPELQEYVDEAIAELPDELSSLVVAHYMQGASKTDLSESLDVSPSTITRRMDRAIEHVRETLRKRGVIVGTVALAGLLPQAAAATPPKTLYAVLGKLAISGSRRFPTGATAAGVSTAIPFAAKFAFVAVGVVAISALGFLYSRAPKSPSTNAFVASEEATIAEPPLTLTSGPEDSVTESEDSSAMETATVSGVVVFRDTGDPAPSMRVLMGAKDGKERSTETDARGSFFFENVPLGEAGVLAYDSRYSEMPEDELRSEHVMVGVAESGAADVRIEVPPLGGEVTGRVYDQNTGVPLAGIQIEAFQFGRSDRPAMTDRVGRYTIFGLDEGEWYIRISEESSIFSSDLTESMPRALVAPGEPATADFAVDRSISISGRVVDATGTPVPDARIAAVLFMNEMSGRRDCHFRSDEHGRFTIWGGIGGERAELRASMTGGKMSPSVVVPTIPGKPVSDVVLTLRSAVNVSGRFVDEKGRPTKADFWDRAVHPNGYGRWSGQAEKPSETFEATMAPGAYEIKGQTGYNFNVEEFTQQLEVGDHDLSDVVIKVRAIEQPVGSHRLKGTVVDDTGKSLRNTRVTVRGPAHSTSESYQETYTDQVGRFSFDNLLNGEYRVRAVPGVPPFEQYAGFDGINPAKTRELKIVTRRAGLLRGRVVDANTGEPVTAFRAEVGNYRGPGNEQKWEFKKATSSSGQFEIRAQLDEDWYIKIEADGYAESIQTGAALSSGEVIDDIKIELATGRIVRGAVTDSDGNAIVGALVYDNGDVFDPSKQRSRFANTTTDAEGQFELRSVSSDTPYVYALKPGLAIGEAPIDDEVNIALTAGGVIDGHVTIAGNIPPSRSSVSVSGSRHGHMEHYSSRTDESGYFRIEHVAAGEYQLDLSVPDETGSHPDSFFLDLTVIVGDGLTTTQDIRVPRGSFVLTGLVTSDGAPLPTYPVRYWRDGMRSFTQTDASGNYRIDGLTGNPVRIEVPFPNADEPMMPHYKTVAEIEFGGATEMRQDIELSEFN